jgi:hypothetical protein
MKRFRRMIGLLGPVAIAASLQAQGTFTYNDVPAFYGGAASPTPPPSFAGTRGWGFSLVDLSFTGTNANNQFLITQLGVFDDGGDGLVNTHQIGLWRADGTLLRAATVPAGTAAPFADGYRWVPIDPYILRYARNPFVVDSTAIIAAQYSAGDADDLVTPYRGTLGSGIYPMINGYPSPGWYAYGADFPFPGLRTPPPGEGELGPGFWEVNFRYAIVPEPSSLALLSGGLCLFVALKRRFRCR